jgi:hypothetical protein
MEMIRRSARDFGMWTTPASLEGETSGKDVIHGNRAEVPA